MLFVAAEEEKQVRFTMEQSIERSRKREIAHDPLNPVIKVVVRDNNLATKSTKSTKSTKMAEENELSVTPRSVSESQEDRENQENQENQEDQEDSEDEVYPHHNARIGNLYQASVKEYKTMNEFDKARGRYQKEMQHKAYSLMWDPSIFENREQELDDFIAKFPPTILEIVYDRIMQNDYDLDKSYQDLLKNPPDNPIINFSPEDELKLEENTDNLAMVHVSDFCCINEIIEILFQPHYCTPDD